MLHVIYQADFGQSVIVIRATKLSATSKLSRCELQARAGTTGKSLKRFYQRDDNSKKTRDKTVNDKIQKKFVEEEKKPSARVMIHGSPATTASQGTC